MIRVPFRLLSSPFHLDVATKNDRLVRSLESIIRGSVWRVPKNPLPFGSVSSHT